ncbi:molybdenum cofactor guanylyltransferase [soil metagenome]
MNSARRLYILCGGQSRRMGQDKAMLKRGDEPLLNRQIRKVSPFFREIVLLSGENHYQVDNRQIKDAIINAGPLAGLLEALKDGANQKLSCIAILPVDLPNLSESTLNKLAEFVPEEPKDAEILRSGKDLQPLAGVYNTELATQLEHYLHSRNRMVFEFVNRLNFSTIEVRADELININRPEDLSS